MSGSKTMKRNMPSLKNNIMQISFKNINDKYCWGQYGDFKVIIMKENGYINATKLCSEALTRNGKKKEFKYWSKLSDTNEKLNKISEYINITTDKLTIIIKGGQKPVITGTYVHPILITHIAYWISPSFSVKVGLWIEKWKTYSIDNELEYFEALSDLDTYSSNNKEKMIQDNLKKKLRGKIEVKTPVGKIDLLTNDTLIEIKTYTNWKCALGQLIAYGTFYPNRRKQMCLFDVGDNEITYIKKICKRNDIELVIYD